MTKEETDLAISILKRTTEYSIKTIKYEVNESKDGDFSLSIFNKENYRCFYNIDIIPLFSTIFRMCYICYNEKYKRSELIIS
jgi:hypothetical protein